MCIYITVNVTVNIIMNTIIILYLQLKMHHVYINNFTTHNQILM